MPVRYALVICGLGVLAGCVLLTLDRLFLPPGHLWVLLVSFTPHGVVGYAAALILLLLARWGVRGRLRPVTGVAAGVALAGLVLGPHLLVGDFNATLDHGPVRDLLDLGLTDAAVEANSGWQPTWPAPGSWDGQRLNTPLPPSPSTTC